MKPEPCHKIAEMADRLCSYGMDVTAAEVFAWLRMRGYLLGGLTDTWNEPSAPSVELGYFTTERTFSMNPDGSVTIHRETLFTRRGWEALLPRFMQYVERWKGGRK